MSPHRKTRGHGLSRSLARSLLLAVLLAPLAAAEGELRLAVEGELLPFTLGEQRVAVAVDVDCSVVSGVPPTVEVHLAVGEAPDWLGAVLERTSLAASPTDCPAGRTTLGTELRLFWRPGGAMPRAGERDTLTLTARAEDLRGNAFEARAEVPVEAGLFGDVRVAPGDPPPTVAPGEAVGLTVVVVNDQNAPVDVEWTPDAAAAAMGVATVRNRVEPETRGVVGFTARIPADAADQSHLEVRLGWVARVGEQQVGAGNETVRMVVVALGRGDAGGGTAAAESPGSPQALVLATVAAAALALARRRRRA